LNSNTDGLLDKDGYPHNILVVSWKRKYSKLNMKRYSHLHEIFISWK